MSDEAIGLYGRLRKLARVGQNPPLQESIQQVGGTTQRPRQHRRDEPSRHYATEILERLRSMNANLQIVPYEEINHNSVLRQQHGVDRFGLITDKGFKPDFWAPYTGEINCSEHALPSSLAFYADALPEDIFLQSNESDMHKINGRWSGGKISIASKGHDTALALAITSRSQSLYSFCSSLDLHDPLKCCIIPCQGCLQRHFIDGHWKSHTSLGKEVLLHLNQLDVSHNNNRKLRDELIEQEEDDLEDIRLTRISFLSGKPMYLYITIGRDHDASLYRSLKLWIDYYNSLSEAQVRLNKVTIESGPYNGVKQHRTVRLISRQGYPQDCRPAITGLDVTGCLELDLSQLTLRDLWNFCRVISNSIIQDVKPLSSRLSELRQQEVGSRLYSCDEFIRIYCFHSDVKRPPQISRLPDYCEYLRSQSQDSLHSLTHGRLFADNDIGKKEYSDLDRIRRVTMLRRINHALTWNFEEFQQAVVSGAKLTPNEEYRLVGILKGLRVIVGLPLGAQVSAEHAQQLNLTPEKETKLDCMLRSEAVKDIQKDSQKTPQQNREDAVRFGSEADGMLRVLDWLVTSRIEWRGPGYQYKYVLDAKEEYRTQGDYYCDHVDNRVELKLRFKKKKKL